MAKLVGGVAIIKVVAATETEMKDKKARVEEAMHVTKAAVEEGNRAGRRRGWIATNAGHEGSIVVQKVQDMKDEEGFNAQTETYENLVQTGVIDPTKVVRSALQNAASIASLLLTTEAVITQIPEKNRDAAMPGGGMGAGMD